MTQIDIEKLRGLLARATAGPWNHLGYCGQDGTIQGHRQEVVASLSSAWGKSDQTGFQCFDNAALIVALRNSADALLSELERKTKALEAVRDFLPHDHGFFAESVREIVSTALKGEHHER